MSLQTAADFPSTSSLRAQLKRLFRLAFITIFVASPAALLGCAEAQLGTHVAKTLGNSGGTGGGVYKVGSPYQIAGQWYTPKEDEGYDREGIASWYGPNFHGKPTANGEVFDQNLVTAAHPTLPMPIYARVTNLENGRSLIVRINDRGPFVADREIDLSRRSAELLGYLNKGTARVRVQYLRRAPLEGDVGDVQSVVADNGDFIMPPAEDARDQERAAPVPTSAVRVASLTPVALGAVGAAANNTLTATDMAPIPDAPSVSSSPVSSSPASQATPTAAIAPGTYVQAGAFSNSANAQALKIQLSDLGPVEVHPVNVNGTEMYRVRVGPVQDPQAANNLLQQVTGRGHSNARVIIE